MVAVVPIGLMLFFLVTRGQGVSDTCIKTILFLQEDERLDLYDGAGIFSQDEYKPIKDISTWYILNETGTLRKESLDILLQNIRTHSQNYLKDFTGDGRVTCEDLVYLLYLGTTEIKKPVRIECTDFWAWYQRNAAFRKFSDGYDLNREDVEHRILNGQSLEFSRSEPPPPTDIDFHQCGNKQCVFSARKCDGQPECTDLTDEQDCHVCPESSVRCKVSGVETCLPKKDLCKYSPDTCEIMNVTFCKEKSWHQKLDDCFNKLNNKRQLIDDTFRLCATNTRNIKDLEDHPDDELFENYWEFNHLSYNISTCQDQVSARLVSCRRSCPEFPDTNSTEHVEYDSSDESSNDTDYDYEITPERQMFQCSTGRCISGYQFCDGQADCPVRQEDEQFGQCKTVQSYYYEDYQICPSPLNEVGLEEPQFPCFKTGHCIPFPLVCDGTEDCPGGEDENSDAWFYGLDSSLRADNLSDTVILDQFRKWVVSYLNMTAGDIGLSGICKKRNTWSFQMLNILVLAFVFCLAVCAALALTPVQRDQTAIKSLQTLNQQNLDIICLQERFELKNTLDFDRAVNNIGDAVKNSVYCQDNLIQLSQSDFFYADNLKDIITNAFFIRQKRKHLNDPKKYNYFDSSLKQKGVVLSFLAMFSTVLDYFFDTQLLYSSYISWEVVIERGFPLKNYFYNIFTTLTILIITSHTLNTMLLLSKKRFDTSKFLSKFVYIISIVFFPVFYLMSFVVFELKAFVWPSQNFEGFMHEEIIRYQFQKSLNEQKVLESCTENMPQLIMLLLLSFSAPLRDKINPILGLTFFFLKATVSFFSFSFQLVSFMNFQRKKTISIIGRCLLSSSCFFFVASRIISILFCIIFSNLFPDLPYFLYFVTKSISIESNVHSFDPELPYPYTPASLKALYSVTVSVIPFVSCIAIILLSAVIYFFSMSLIHKWTDEKPSLKIQLLSTAMNTFCPIKQPMKFTDLDSKKNIYNNRKALLLTILMFVITNFMLVLVPFLCYGMDMFLTSLPVLDEMMRFLSLMFRTDKLPAHFPPSLPKIFLHAHLLFPAVVSGNLVLGLLLLLMYQKWGKPWKQVSVSTQE